MDATPRISPVVVHLAAEQVAADPPHVLEFTEADEILMADEDVVDILNLKRKMIEASTFISHTEESVVVNIIVAGIDPTELPDDVVLFPGIHIVRADETQCLAEPANRLLVLRRPEDGMT